MTPHLNAAAEAAALASSLFLFAALDRALDPKPEPGICSNCGDPIENPDDARTWSGSIVCDPCHDDLSSCERCGLPGATEDWPTCGSCAPFTTSERNGVSNRDLGGS